MRRLRVRKIVRAEIVAAFEWYVERSPTAAEHFLDAVDDAMRGIGEAPEQHPIIRGRLRRVLVRRFPYAVYYKARSRSSVVGMC